MIIISMECFFFVVFFLLGMMYNDPKMIGPLDGLLLGLSLCIVV